MAFYHSAILPQILLWSLRFKPHINSCIRIAYLNLKLIYNNKDFLSVPHRKLLCESLVLSRFNYTLYRSNIDSDDARRIQVVQNSCLRLIFGIRRREHISHKLFDVSWLNMKNRRLFSSLCLFQKIIFFKYPKYLYRKITFRADVNNLNVRFKGQIISLLHKKRHF